MSLFEWASSFVGGSTITQAGAIDIIAVRRSDGSLSCSPFHVKLGKIPKKGEKKIVSLKVNGKDVPLSMKLGPAGEAFFVERTREVNVRNSSWLSPPMSPNGPLSSYDNCVSASFPLTSPLNVQPALGVISSISVKVEPMTSVVQPVRQRSYSESDAIDHHSSDIAEIGTSSNEPQGQEGLDCVPILPSTNGTAAAAAPGDLVAVLPSPVPGPHPSYRRDRSVSDMSSVSSLLPPLLPPPHSSAAAAATDADPLPLPQEVGGAAAVSQSSAAAPVSWIWSWGALPKKSKSNKSLVDLTKAESKHHSASGGAAGGTAAAASISGGTSLTSYSGLELRPTPDDVDPPAAAGAGASVGPGFGSPSGVILSSGSSVSSAARGGNNVHADDRTLFMSNALNKDGTNSGIKPLSSLLESLDSNNISSSGVPIAGSTVVVSVVDQLSAEQSEAKPSRSSGSMPAPEYREVEEEVYQQLEVEGPEEQEEQQQQQQLRLEGGDLEEGEDHQWGADRSRLLSLCGHVLSGDVSAPEPVPLSSEDLLKVLHSYRVTDRELHSDSSLVSHSSHLVIVIDDFLLTLEVAEKLVVRCGEGGGGAAGDSEKGTPFGLSLTSDLISQVLAEGQREEDRGTGSSAIPSWVGAKISSWGLPTNSDSNSREAVGLTMIGEGSPGSVLHHNRQQFVTWSSDHLGWRDSFSDLVQAYKVGHSSSTRLASMMSSEAESHSDFLKAYIASTPASTQHTPGSAGHSRGRRLSDPSSGGGGVTLSSHMEGESDYFIPSHSQDDSDNSCNNSVARLSNDLHPSEVVVGSAHTHSLLLPLIEGENEDAVTPPPPADSAGGAVTPSLLSGSGLLHSTPPAAILTSPPRIISPPSGATVGLSAPSAPSAAVPAVPVFRGTVSVSDLLRFNPSDPLDSLLGGAGGGDLTDTEHTSLEGGGGPTDSLSLEDIDLEDIDPAAGGDFYDSDTDSYLSYDNESDSGGGSRGRTPRGAAGGALSHSNSFDGPVAGSAAGVLNESLKRKSRRYRYRKVLVPSKEQLELLQLMDGENELTFQLEGCPPLKAQLFVWPENAKILVTDIEGVLLHKATSKAWVSFLGGTSSKNITNHTCNSLLNAVADNNYRILYIASSSSSLSSTQPLVSSKDYLASLSSTPTSASASTSSSSSGNTSSASSSSSAPSASSSVAAQTAAAAAKAALKCPLKIPNGPIFKSPETLIRTFGAERTDVFKAAALRGIKNLFPHNHNPYHACFATRLCDVNAFSRFGFPDGRIFLVDERGELHTSHRLKKSSFSDLQELVHQVFPFYQDVSRLSRRSSVCSSVVSPTEPAPSDSSFISSQSSSKVPPLLLSGAASAATAAAVAPPLSTPTAVATAEDTYNDFNYWRMPLPVFDD